jgi:hypothetical protein
MALVDLHYAFVTFGDSRGKESTVQFRVTAAEALDYFQQLTQILKDGTPLGLFFLSIEDLSAGTFRGKGVKLITIDDAIGFPAPNANLYNFDKLQVSYTALGNQYNMSIPNRDDAVYVVGTDGVTVDLTTPAAVTQFITRFAAVVLSKYGDAGAVNEIIVSS